MSVIDASTDNVVSTRLLFSVFFSPFYNFIAYSSINDSFYLSMNYDDVVSVINAATNSLIKDIEVTCRFAIAYNLINHNLYAASSDSNQVYVI